MAVMALSGAALYALAPAVFTMLTADAAIRELGSRVLRIEAFAEPAVRRVHRGRRSHAGGRGIRWSPA